MNPWKSLVSGAVSEDRKGNKSWTMKENDHIDLLNKAIHKVGSQYIEMLNKELYGGEPANYKPKKITIIDRIKHKLNVYRERLDTAWEVLRGQHYDEY